MPAADAGLQESVDEGQPLTELPFPPVTKSQILHCSYHSWHPRYRAITPKARLIPLSQPFLDYLRADGIVLPPESDEPRHWSDSDSGIFSSAEDHPEEDEDEEDEDPSAEWPEIHSAIRATIADLGGKVVPKLNWSAPKDATWIAATNSMECRTPNDIYLLLKSSDFVTHDLEHAFDDCVDDATFTADEILMKETAEIPYHLVLRKHVQLNPSLEFRCFVRNRKLIGICQRDLNHFDFLFKMQDTLRERIQNFFVTKLKNTFPDDNFTFDVYIPPPHERVWLIDINPWAQRTDPLLFSWLELLTMPDSDLPDDVALEEGEDEEAIPFIPEVRLIGKDDPEAYGFTTPQYSAHKLPRDVVDASQAGPGPMREFADQWKDVLARRQKQEQDTNSESE